MQLSDFYFFIVPLVALLMLLIPVILYYARKEEKSSRELTRLQEETKFAIPIMKGPEAIEHLEMFINELEQSDAAEMTEQQTESMIKVAQVLITTINNEKPLLARLMRTDFLPKLKEAMEKLLHAIATTDEQNIKEQITDLDSEVLYKPKQVKTL